MKIKYSLVGEIAYAFFFSKKFLTMRLTFLLMLVGIFQVIGKPTYSQEAKLTLNFNDRPVIEVLDEIEDNSEFYFLFNQKLVDVNRRVQINVENADIDKVLDIVFDGTNTEFKIIDRQIILSPAYLLNEDQEIPPQGETKITGTVTDTKGNPLPGVTVLLKDSNTGTITDYNGKYTITIDKPEGTLVFSYMGFTTSEVPISGKTEINVVLQEDILSLDEVVVVGYGTQKKVNLTGAVDAVSGKALENRPVADISQAIQGVSPNLNINISKAGGEPGSKQSWNIRGIGSLSGNDSPLILVDGVQMNIENVDPNDIENISVLKDAAASAIYGSRAAFGVVLITTKRGSKNEKMHVSYSANFGWASPTTLPKFANSVDLAKAYNQASGNSGVALFFPKDQVQRMIDYQNGSFIPEYDTSSTSGYTNIWRGRKYGNANYDWIDIHFKDHSFRQKQNVSVYGGDKTTSYYVSAGFTDQEGLLTFADDAYSRYNVMANIHSDVTSWMRMGFSSKYALTQTNHPQAPEGNNDRGIIFEEMQKFWPNTPYYNTEGEIINPYVLSLMDGGRISRDDNALMLTLDAEIEPIKGWKTKATYNWNINTYQQSNHQTKVMVPVPNGEPGNIGFNTNNIREQMQQSHYRLFNVYTSYEKQVKKHYFMALAGYENEYYYYNGSLVWRNDLITNAVPSIRTAIGEDGLDNWKGHWATEGIFGRFAYNFDGKYLFEFNARYDGSSRFAEDSRYGFFPSASVGYNISKENFWQPIEHVVNNLKIRASYGSLGNQNVDNYIYLSLIPIHNQLPWIMGNERPLYAGVPPMVNRNITWETVNTLDFGVDAAFINNRLGLTFDWYNRTTKNMLGPAEALPAVLGGGIAQMNNAELSTKGYEVTLAWKDVIGKDFSYHVKFSLGDNQTKVLKYKNDLKVLDSWYEGQNIGEIWGYETDGFIQEEGEDMPDQSKFYNSWGPGDIKYIDQDGNDTINDGNFTLSNHGDLKVIGNMTPRYNFAINLGFNWKGLDFNMFWQGVAKRDYYFRYTPHTNLFYGITGFLYHSTVFEEHLDYWRPEGDTVFGANTDAYYPKVYADENVSQKNFQKQSKYVVNGAYIRLKNIQIGYTLPAKWTEKAYISKLRIYVSGENLLTFTKMPKFLDPELAISGLSKGDGKIYPLSKVYSFGINITF